jgi:hypothetical protein
MEIMNGKDIMNDYNWSNDLNRLKFLILNGGIIATRLKKSGKATDYGFAQMIGGTIYNLPNMGGIGMEHFDDVSDGLEFIDPDPIRNICEFPEGDEPKTFFEIAVSKTKELDTLRQNLCRNYDDLVSELDLCDDDFGDSQKLRNIMDGMHNVVLGVATMEGHADLKPLATNYTTLNRYIP